MKKFLLLLVLPFFLSGCSAIVGSSSETVSIESTPEQAKFIITDNHGNIVAKGTTPQTVQLKKSDGSYFGRISYTLSVMQDGYNSEGIPLEYRLSRWYTFGNIIFFGVPGWLIVDPFFGGMYTFRNDKMHIWLRPCPQGPYSYMCS
ncbi:hypothetical protein EGM70_18640 [Enterobacteriaceae bacterium 89]|nr:hypothetical protein [Enterobacteriaceae bacterium 89]